MPCFSVALLAGGESRRFGQDKALAPLDGRPLLAHLLAQTAGLGAETFIVTNRPEAYARFNQRLVGDLWPGSGVLGGLYTALHSAAHPWVLCLACDMPLVNRSLLAHLLTLTEGVEAVVPRLNQQAEPLHAVWARTCLAPIRAALERGERRAISFLPDVRVRWVDTEEVRRFDPTLQSFFNINTPADLARAEQLLQAS